MYNLNICLFVGPNNFSQSLLLAEAVVVWEKTRDFEYQFSNWLAAVGTAAVVLFTNAYVNSSNTAKTIFSHCKHFMYIAKNVLPKVLRKT